MKKIFINKQLILLLLLASLTACAAPTTSSNYHDPSMDFASLRTIAILPFQNLTRDNEAAGRVRDILFNNLMATGAVYVIPSGEVGRAISRAGIIDPTTPSTDEIAKLAALIKVDAVITGVVREYGTVRSGTTSANVISLSLRMIEAQSQKVVWAASSTKGGIRMVDRLLGGGGQPMNDVTEAAIDDIIAKLFQ